MTAINDSTYRQTKIIATLGPSTSSKKSIEGLIDAGVDLIRLNFSHGDKESHIKRAKLVREIADKKHYHIGIVGDLQGPKIRITRFINSKIDLKNGSKFTIDYNHPFDKGTEEVVGTTYKDLVGQLDTNDILLLDDGRIELKVEKISGSKIVSKVISGGLLYDSKGINKKGGGLSAAAISEKDHEDIKVAAEIGVDYLAVSFPREAKDIEMARKLLNDAGNDGGIIAKIERAEALKNIDEIIEASNAIMIARGDLGVEIGDAQLPAVQKNLIKKARKKDKVVITATQMMESMITQMAPTRAEVNDVANAVLDGADAVMLSGETSVGNYPVEVINAMAKIINEMELDEKIYSKEQPAEKNQERFISDSICYNACRLAQRVEVDAIITMSFSGYTAYKIASQRPRAGIYVFTSNRKILTQLNLVWGVRAFYYNKQISTDHTISDIKDFMISEGYLKTGDLFINIASIPLKDLGSSNMIKLSQVD